MIGLFCDGIRFFSGDSKMTWLFRRLFLVAGLGLPSLSEAQSGLSVRAMLVPAEHASGGEAPMALAALGAAAVAVYDIVSAPASARWYNQRALAVTPFLQPEERRVGLAFSMPLSLGSSPREPLRLTTGAPGRKSPAAALALSLGATAVPIALGAMLGSTDAVSNEAVGALVAGGILIGPSVGHWYSERWVRGFATVALRAAAGALVLVFEGCCT